MGLQTGLVEGLLYDGGARTAPSGSGAEQLRPSSYDRDDAVRTRGRYHLAGVLGRGTAATVFRAFDVEEGRTIALKVFVDPAGGQLPDHQYHHEASMLNSARHDGVVRLLGGGTCQAGPAGVEHHYLSLELLEGADLRALIGQRHRSPEETIRWGLDLLQALVHIHQVGIVHRDIKPANVIANADEDGTTRRAKLIDFGSACYGESAKSGHLQGTAQYTSPEQARESAAGPASDIYSLGLVLIECLTGKPAFTGIPLATMAARTLRPPELPAGIPARLSELLRSMTSIEPAERPSADAAVRMLAAV